MSDPRNVAHDKKVIQVKHKHGEDLAKGAAHLPRPGKENRSRRCPRGAQETELEEAGGNLAPAREVRGAIPALIRSKQSARLGHK